MKCETAGSIRAYVDGELDSVAVGRLEGHLAACPPCRARLERVRANAATVAFHLRSSIAAPEVAASQEERVWASLQARIGDDRRSRSQEQIAPAGANPGKRNGQPNPPDRYERRWRMPVLVFSLRQRSGLAAALAAVFLLVVIPIAGLSLVPAGRATAVEFLNLFRPQRFQAVTVDPRVPFEALAKLESLGTMTMPSAREYSASVTDESLDQVGANLGLKVRRPTMLPPGVTGSPTVLTTQPAKATFTVDRQKAEAYLRSAGASNPSVPPQLDGARLVINVPGAVIQAYGDDTGQLALVVAQLNSPTAVVEGNTNLAELRQFLLSVPGLPADTVAQLRAIDDWTTTVPIPIPRDEADSREVSVGGAQGLIVSDLASGVSGLIWQRDGVVFGLAGMVSQQQLLGLAGSLQ